MVVGRMRRMDQWMFFARRGAVESVVGRIIQRRTREMVRRLRGGFWECRAWRKEGRVVVGVRERR